VKNVFPYTTATGIPAKPAGEHKIMEAVNLNHHLIPDPVKDVLDSLTKRIEKLEGKIKKLSEKGEVAVTNRRRKGQR
jgi:serine O-acetyltransferase